MSEWSFDMAKAPRGKIRLIGWDRSSGARAEKALAQALGLLVIILPADAVAA